MPKDNVYVMHMQEILNALREMKEEFSFSDLPTENHKEVVKEGLHLLGIDLIEQENNSYVKNNADVKPR